MPTKKTSKRTKAIGKPSKIETQKTLSAYPPNPCGKL